MSMWILATTCHFNLIRFIRCIYGAPYMDKPLFFNWLRYFYTVYTVCQDTTLYIMNTHKKSVESTRSRAYEVKMAPYKPYNPYKTYLKPLKINVSSVIRFLKHTV